MPEGPHHPRTPHPHPLPDRGGEPRRGRASGAQIAAARAMRGAPTRAERHLWRTLRGWRRDLGLHVRRQAPVGPYIADFAILSEALLIELDGSGPGGPRDRMRDAWLASQGFRILRFWNHDVLENTEGVLQTIRDATSHADPTT